MQHQYKIKFQVIYLPFIALLVGIFLSYSFFRWLVDIQLGILSFRETTWDLWLPILLPVLPIWWIMLPRVQLLEIKDEAQKDSHFAYLLFMMVAIALPTILFQDYLKESSLELIEVATANQVTSSSYPKEKYFKITSFELDKSTAVATTQVIGEDENKLQYTIHYLCPFENTANLWYGTSHKKVISNKYSEAEETSIFKNFTDKSQQEFRADNFQQVTYFERVIDSKDRAHYETAFSEYYVTGDPSTMVILSPRTGAFEDRAGDSVFWTFVIFLGGALVLLMLIVFPSLNKTAWSNFRHGKTKEDVLLQRMFFAINPRSPYKATAFLFWVHVATFLGVSLLAANTTLGSQSEWFYWGALSGEAVLKQGAYWQVFTALFVPGSLGLLVTNLFMLIIGGLFLEPVLGAVKSLYSYFILGMGAQMASVYWSRTELFAVGGSVALWGWLGILCFLALAQFYSKISSLTLLAFLVPYLFFCWLISFTEYFNGIAHWLSFLGGVVLGILLFLFHKNALQKPTETTF